MRYSVVAIILLIFIVIFSIFIANLANIVSSDKVISESVSEYKVFNNKNKFKIDDGSDHLMWFLQISDLHISIFNDDSRMKELQEFANTTVEIIKPKIVLASGDLTDAKDSDKLGSRQYRKEWEIYKNILETTNVGNRTIWLDIRGNHDYFNVPDINSKYNYFSKYSVQGSKHQRSYMQQIIDNSTTYTFIAIDASLEPGPKRPFNFIGLLEANETNRLIELSEIANSAGSNYTIWFSHYPTSCIISPGDENIPIRQVVGTDDKSFAYLSGHLHTLGGMVPHMYAIQKGFIELELGDWKENRLYRVAAFDHGLFSFVDVIHNDWPIILITNPKHALFNIPDKEHPSLQLESSNIRLLIFTPSIVTECSIKIDDSIWKKCDKKSTNLYTLKWSPEKYNKGIHYISVYVMTGDGISKKIQQPFSLDGSRLSFDLLARLALMLDICIVFQWLFVTAFLLCIGPLLVLRIIHEVIARKIFNSKWNFKKLRLPNIIRKLWILSSVNRICFPLIIYCIYLLFGPWAIGEVIDDHYGIIFVWGIYVNGKVLPGTMSYIYGFFQLLLCQFPLTIVYANIVHERYSFYKNGEKSATKENYIYLPLVIIILVEIILVLFFWNAYGTIALIAGPLRTWTIVFHFILWYLASTIPQKSLKSVMNVL